MINQKPKIKNPVKNGAAKVPVIMQMEALECGAACLAMVLAYYGKWIPLEQVRYDCGVSRDGSNAKNIFRAARNYGLEVSAYRLEPEVLRDKGMFPCIVHWNFNHFIVCDGFKGNRVYINDPARGTLTMSPEEFDLGFTGIVLMFKPGEDFVPSGKRPSVFRYALEKLKQTRSAIIITVTISLATALLGIINPVFSRVFVDRLLSGRNPGWAVPFIVLMSVFAAVRIALAWVQALASKRIGGKLSAVGNSSFLWKVMHLPMEFFSQRMAGDIQMRQFSNASIADTVINTLAPLVLQTIMMVVYLCLMLRYSVLLTLIGIASIVLDYAVSDIVSRLRVNVTRVQMRDAGKLSGTTVAGIEMIETIKSAGAENGFFEKWAGLQAAVNTSEAKFKNIEAYLGIIPSVVSAITDASVLIIGILLVIRGHFTLGCVYAFQSFLASFTAPAQSLISARATLEEMRTDMERIEDVMRYPEDPLFSGNRSDTPATVGKLSGKLEMKNVTFGYSRLGEPLIRDFNLTLEPGHHVAFVGTSGCGKSTLANLIAGLYQPWSGEILFDGKPVSSIDRSVFTGSVAVVDQDIILFEDTVANNIKMWDRSIEDFEMIMAARDAQIHNDIVKRDGGYQGKILEGGKDLSGGQRQRLEIARVLAQDPTIIIMDEATSALDAKTEYDVVRGIQDRGITTIVVAHRLSTIRDCDEIIVLDHGSVAERGTHEQLMALGGFYRELVTGD